MLPFVSDMLAEVFPELKRAIEPLPGSATAQTFDNPFIDAEVILDPTLSQAWFGTSKLKTENCVRILHLTLRRFEYLQHRVSLAESWNIDEPILSLDHRRLVAHDDLELSEVEYRPFTFKTTVDRRKCDLHALFVNALPEKRLQQVLNVVLCEVGKRMLQLPIKTRIHQEYQEDEEQIPETPFTAKLYLDKLVERMCDVGLGGPPAERAFAVAADRLMSSFVEVYFGDLTFYIENVRASGQLGKKGPANLSREIPILALQDKMVEVFCRVLHAFMWPLESLRENVLGLEQGFTWSNLRDGREEPIRKEMRSLGQDRNIVFWVERAKNELREIRATQSFDIITRLDGHVRRCGLVDIREICVDPYGRNIIAQGLEKQIDKQLVRPGTSTVDVLDTYMLIIGTLSQPAFDTRKVDPTNVLLTRSAGPVRSFLRNREDAARIVILSLLDPRPLEVVQTGHHATQLPPISVENFSGQISVAMYYRSNPHDAHEQFEGHDLLDPEWTPAKVDALSGHKFNLSLDTIGHITSIAPPEIFVRELEHLLGDRLLKTDQLNFEVEMRLLKIFHARFGDSQIQACENMLNDMMESAKWNEKIQPFSDESEDGHIQEDDFQARIVSQASWQELRWDQLQKEQFRLPEELEVLRKAYEIQFSELQDDRHLEWVPQLGRVTMDLQFQDREVFEEATPLQAAVIYQFVDPPTPAADAYSPPAATRTFEQIKEALQGDDPAIHADDSSIRAALAFWVSKIVLQHHAFAAGPDTPASDSYTVLESLTAAEEEAAAVAAAQSPELIPAAIRTRAEILAEHAATYTAYITGMLTNQGAMDVERIHTLLKMLAPGGFAFDVEDLEGLLEDMLVKGRIARFDGLWKILQE